MNTTKQFWALVKFQVWANPVLLIYPLIFLMPLWIQHVGHGIKEYHSSLDLLLFSTIQNYIFVGMAAMLVLAPEAFYTGANATVSGTEFFLTRAIDRPMLARSRTAIFYAIFLLPTLVGLALTISQPDLVVDEYQKISHQQILAHVPESVPAPADKYGRSTTIAIPHGNLLIEEWRAAQNVVVALSAQIVVFLLYPLKRRRFWLIAVFLVVGLSPLLGIYDNKPSNEMDLYERSFFALLDHQGLFWSAAVAAFLLTPLWCERRFARMEF